MTDWFDPRTWLRPLGDPAGAAREFWSGATSAWFDDLVGVARDRAVEIRHGDTVVRGTIRRIDARPVVTPTAWMSGDRLWATG